MKQLFIVILIPLFFCENVQTHELCNVIASTKPIFYGP